MNIIRKIIIGKEITKSAMSYQLGQPVYRNQYKIESIVKQENGSYVIYIEKDGEIITWKEISKDVPTTVEFSLDFSGK